MRIVDIFAEKLYSICYEECENNEYRDCEYDRLLDLWTDVSYLREYAKRNNVDNINKFVKERLRDVEKIEDLLEELTKEERPLDLYFHQLDNMETGFKLLSLRKGKASKQDGLRIYAIKIDDNCFLITGGAIKMSLKMKDHPDTALELTKIEEVKAFLKRNDVSNRDSFYELKTELEDEDK